MRNTCLCNIGRGYVSAVTTNFKKHTKSKFLWWDFDFLYFVWKYLSSYKIFDWIKKWNKFNQWLLFLICTRWIKWINSHHTISNLSIFFVFWNHEFEFFLMFPLAILRYSLSLFLYVWFILIFLSFLIHSYPKYNCRLLNSMANGLSIKVFRQLQLVNQENERSMKSLVKFVLVRTLQ